MAPKTKKKKQQNKNGLVTIIVVIIILAAVSIITGWYFSDKHQETKPAVTEQTNNSEAETQQAVKSALEGTWVSNYDGAMLSITGLSFSLELASVDKSKIIKGTILVKDNLVTFINKEAICKDIQGQYKFTIKGNDLTFRLVNDDCASRKERMTAGWFRL